MRTAQNTNGDDFTFASDRLNRLVPHKSCFRSLRKGYSRIFSSTWLMLLFLPLLMWQCKEDDFQGELVGICPEVIYTDPIRDTINVALNKQVSATFNENMNPLTINEDTYLLHQGTTLISGTVTYSGATALFSPDDPFTPNTVYTGTITTGAQDPMGNALEEDYVWSFTTLPQYTVQLSSSPTAGGTTMGGGLYLRGSTVIVTAHPGIGYTFINWTEGDLDASPDESYTFTAMSNRGLVANFSLNAYSLTVLAEHGSVEKDPILASYAHGSTVELTATPEVGYTFTGWSGDATGTDSPLTVTMDANKTITANFSLNAYTLTVIAEHGSVEKDPLLLAYNHGVSVVLTPEAEVGYTFSGWSGDATGNDDPLTVTMDDNKTITALFTQNTYTLTVIAENGSVEKDPLLLTYTHGASVVLTPEAEVGYTFSGWSGNATGNANPLTVTMDANKTITALFTQNTYTLTVVAEHGSVAKNPTLLAYNHGASVVLTPSPEVGYTFTGWSGNATGNANPLTVTMDANKTITANFSQDAFTLTVIAEHGSVAKNPLLLSYTLGASVVLTPTPEIGYTFTGWSGDATGNDNPLTVLMTGNKTITALFTATPPVGPGPVDFGSAIDFSVLTKTGISTDIGTLINGNIGVNPAAAASITGFGLIMNIGGASSHTPMVTGNVFAPDYADPTPAKMVTAHDDMLIAYTAANDLVTPAPVNELGGGNISGMTLAPGLYKWTTGLLITNAGVTLEGGPNDTWVFQVAQNLTVNNSAIVTLLGGAQAKNIVWVVAGQATLGTDTNFKGSIMAYELISLDTGASVTGRLFSQAAVTLNTNCVVIEPD